MRVLLDGDLGTPQVIEMVRKSMGGNNKVFVMTDATDFDGKVAKYFADGVYYGNFMYNSEEMHTGAIYLAAKRFGVDLIIPRYFLGSSVYYDERVFASVMAESKKACEISNDKLETYHHISSSVDFDDSILNVIPLHFSNVCKEVGNYLKSTESKGYVVKKRVGIAAEGVYIDSGDESHEGDNLFFTMEKLHGMEISVDVFSTSDDEIHCVPRLKAGYAREYYEIPEIISACKELYKMFEFKYIVNMQFMKSRIDNQYKLLEINPRVSGGIHMSSKLIETNIIDVALRKMHGMKQQTKDYSKKHYLVMDIPTITVVV